jgi:hypothetical protein
MGLPVVGKRPSRKTCTPEATDRDARTVPERIGSAVSLGRSSANHQRPIQAQRPAKNSQRALGALHLQRITPERNFDTGHLHCLRQEQDSSALGLDVARPREDHRGGAVAAGDGCRQWDQGQDQDRDVGHVFPCRALGIFDAQPDLLRDTGGIGREERSERGCTGERQAPERSSGIVTGGSQAWSRRDAVPRSTSGFPHGITGNRRGETAALRWMDCDSKTESFTSGTPTIGGAEGISKTRRRRHRQSLCPCIRH